MAVMFNFLVAMFILQTRNKWIEWIGGYKEYKTDYDNGNLLGWQ